MPPGTDGACPTRGRPLWTGGGGGGADGPGAAPGAALVSECCGGDG